MTAAMLARQEAVAPYSGFAVGAAILTGKGRTITGANVESASYGLTCCAERVALFKALTEGERSFVAIAVAARLAGGPTPCGACRQLLSEYAPRALVFVVDSKDPHRARTFKMSALLPHPFGEFRGKPHRRPARSQSPV